MWCAYSTLTIYTMNVCIEEKAHSHVENGIMKREERINRHTNVIRRSGKYLSKHLSDWSKMKVDGAYDG